MRNKDKRKASAKNIKSRSKPKSIENSGNTMLKLQNVPKISQMKERPRRVVDQGKTNAALVELLNSHEDAVDSQELPIRERRAPKTLSRSSSRCKNRRTGA
jgi:hypothetical protein